MHTSGPYTIFDIYLKLLKNFFCSTFSMELWLCYFTIQQLKIQFINYVSLYIPWTAWCERKQPTLHRQLHKIIRIGLDSFLLQFFFLMKLNAISFHQTRLRNQLFSFENSFENYFVQFVVKIATLAGEFFTNIISFALGYSKKHKYDISHNLHTSVHV